MIEDVVGCRSGGSTFLLGRLDIEPHVFDLGGPDHIVFPRAHCAPHSIKLDSGDDVPPGAKGAGMCNLYSLITPQAEVQRVFGLAHDHNGIRRPKQYGERLVTNVRTVASPH